MIDYRDNYIHRYNSEMLDIAVSSVLGDRKEQQDRVACLINESETLVVVCDGMGGHEYGNIASNLAVKAMVEEYSNHVPVVDIHGFLLNSITNIDRRIASMKKEDGSMCQAGTTIASLIIRDNSLFWATAGDSRIYIHRKEELVRVTKDHTYQTILDEKMKAGQISSSDYERESSNGGALISFLGINGLPLIENNPTPLNLRKDDTVIVMSDGLYKVLPDQIIKEILESQGELHEKLLDFEETVRTVACQRHMKRDNMTIVLIKIK